MIDEVKSSLEWHGVKPRELLKYIAVMPFVVVAAVLLMYAGIFIIDLFLNIPGTN